MCGSSKMLRVAVAYTQQFWGGLLPGLGQLTAQLRLVPRLRMAGAVPVLALHGIYKYSFTFLK
jgi:hypothetical protein